MSSHANPYPHLDMQDSYVIHQLEQEAADAEYHPTGQATRGRGDEGGHRYEAFEGHRGDEDGDEA